MIDFNNDTLYALEFIRKTVMILPGVTEKLCFDTPAFYVNNKIFSRIKEDGENLIVYNEERTVWMNKDPDIYFITAHYENYKYMLVNLKLVEPNMLKQLLNEAWLKRAPKSVINKL